MKSLNNTVWLLSEKFIALGGGLIGNIIIARTLQPEIFGTLNFLLATTMLFLPLMTFGMNSIITRELCNYPERQNEILKSFLVIRGFSSIFTFLISFFVISIGTWFDVEYKAFFIVLMASQIFSPLEVFNYWFESKVNSKPIVITRTLITLLFIIIKISSVVLYEDLLALICIIGVEYALGYLLYLFCFQSFSGGVKGVIKADLNLGYLKSILKKSSVLILSSFAAVIYMKIDQVMLGSMSSSVDVAIYSVAVKFSEMAYFIPVAIVTSLFPGILLTKSRGNPRAYELKLKLIIGGLFWLAFIGACICSLISESLILHTYGSEYLSSVAVLNIHIWGSVFVFVRALVSKWLLAESLYKYSLYTQGAGALTNIILNWLFIPLYGPEGAAWTTIISLGVSSWLSLFLSSNTRVMGKNIILAPLIFIRHNIVTIKVKS